MIRRTLVGVALALGCSSSSPSQIPDAGACACPAVPSNVVHLPLACLCAGTDQDPEACGVTQASLEGGSNCVRGGNKLERSIGCGRAAYTLDGVSNGTIVTFSQATRALIGVYQFSDISFGACAAYSYVYGEGLFSSNADVKFEPDRCAELSSCFYCPAGSSNCP